MARTATCCEKAITTSFTSSILNKIQFIYWLSVISGKSIGDEQPSQAKLARLVRRLPDQFKTPCWKNPAVGSCFPESICSLSSIDSLDCPYALGCSHGTVPPSSAFLTARRAVATGKRSDPS